MNQSSRPLTAHISEYWDKMMSVRFDYVQNVSKWRRVIVYKMMRLYQSMLLDIIVMKVILIDIEDIEPLYIKDLFFVL
jgi:hypothetical protein